MQIKNEKPNLIIFELNSDCTRIEKISLEPKAFRFVDGIWLFWLDLSGLPIGAHYGTWPSTRTDVSWLMRGKPKMNLKIDNKTTVCINRCRNENHGKTIADPELNPINRAYPLSASRTLHHNDYRESTPQNPVFPTFMTPGFPF